LKSSDRGLPPRQGAGAPTPTNGTSGGVSGIHAAWRLMPDALVDAPSVVISDVLSHTFPQQHSVVNRVEVKVLRFYRPPKSFYPLNPHPN